MPDLQPPRALDPATGQPVPDKGSVVTRILQSRTVRVLLIMVVAFLMKKLLHVSPSDADTNEIADLVIVTLGSLAAAYYRVIAVTRILPPAPPTPPTP